MANWLREELFKLIEEQGESFATISLKAEKFADLLSYLEKNTISAAAAKKILSQIYNDPNAEIEAIIDKEGFRQVNDDSQIKAWIDEVISANPKQVEDYKNGQEKMLGFLVGQVLKKSNKKANPKIVNELLREKLN